MCEKNNENVNDHTFAKIYDFSRKSTEDEVLKQESKRCRTVFLPVVVLGTSD